LPTTIFCFRPDDIFDKCTDCKNDIILFKFNNLK
jgi:hypothetical protein